MGGNAVSHKKRLVFTLFGTAGVFLLLIGRLFYLMLIDGENLQEMALSQWTRDTAISAARGEILDVNGVVLAQSGTAYKILLWPNSIAAAERERIATELANLLGMDYASVLAKVSDTSKQQIELKRGVERSVVDQLASRQLGTGVGTAVDTKRYYPNSSLFSQLLGFTTVDGVGQSGLEQRYDKYLAGENGRTILETDRKGNALAYGSEEIIEPIDGYNVILTVDSVVQSFLESALKEALEVNQAESAQGIIMNCKTGEILATSTQPDYDPNSPPRSDYDLLTSLSRNRIVSDSYEPGSTFKIITLAAALDSNTVNLNNFYSCPGYVYVNGERIRCWRTAGHGSQNLSQALQNSCNCAFVNMALSMGSDTLYDYIGAFGFGTSTGSGIGGEASGIVTNQKYVTDNTLARIGFGQSIAVTPIQLATAVCAAVNGGYLMQPYVVSRIVANNGTVIVDNEPTVVRQVISKETSETLRTLLEGVVAEGSGKNAQVAGYRVGGKTGTAQKYGDNGKIADGALIASFIGFAPADDPEFVILILVDEPKVGTIFGSTVAAPFVSEVLGDMLRYYGHLPEQAAEIVTVPDLAGLTVDEAISKLKAQGLGAVYQVDKSDQVVAQVPAAGHEVAKGTEVLLYTLTTDVERSGSEEEQTVRVPNVIGMTRLEASDALKGQELTILITPQEQTGKAIRQVPAAGESVPIGTEVLVEFSDIELGIG